MLDSFDAEILSLSSTERSRNLVVQGDNSVLLPDIHHANLRQVSV
ncbi:hypothetical protein THF1C08_80057 [Vibrio jasicida]|nr:hypothetical protein THF1C08_80057 [Vibrio jasicida]